MEKNVKNRPFDTLVASVTWSVVNSGLFALPPINVEGKEGIL